jgi:hypothetical protein
MADTDGENGHPLHFLARKLSIKNEAVISTPITHFFGAARLPFEARADVSASDQAFYP